MLKCGNQNFGIELFFKISFLLFTAILLLFLNLKIGYDRDISTSVYHAYEFFGYFFAIVGAIVADSGLGIYKTILLMSVVFAIGSFTIAVSVIDALHLPLE